ncbi:MAG TPA: flagellar hook-associated protein FlgK [Terracidiphilus sp.]|nr:flagellar hook-associated protein FlgK [Terracidiphilus sp.]
MGTISSAFNLIAGALDANQGALDIVANNVANANTTGYTREVPNWQENPPVVINGTTYGEGVTMTGPTAVRDSVLEQRLNQQQQLASSSGAQLAALNTLQSLFTPDSGSAGAGAGDIGSDLTKFFSSFSSLEANPTNAALRQQVLSSAALLAGDVSSAAASLNQQQSALDQEAAGVTTQVNALTTAIAKLNQQIQTIGATGDASSLQDQRQQDLNQLSQLIGINEVKTENNGLSVTTTSGQLLVSQAASFELTSSPVSGVTHFFVNGTDITSELTSGGGELGGYLTARDVNIPDALSSLDELAYNVSTAVNTQNNAGTDLAGDNGGAGDIFYQPAAAAGSAATMSVVMTDPNHIAAAANGAGTGDNSNATAIADLANQGIVNGDTPTNFFAAFVSQLGALVSQVQTENTAQNASVTQLQSQRDALSGVNLNDEAAAMQQYERSYQAASQVFSILNTVIASALNMGVETAVS